VPLKSSRFNLVIPDCPEPGEHLLFNTFHDSLAVVSDEVKEVVNHPERCDRLSRDERAAVDELKELKFLKDPSEDETALLRDRLKKLEEDRSVLSVTLLPTQQCNFACSYCFEDGIDRRATMTREVAAHTLTWIEKKACEVQPREVRLVFFGGEPLLRPDLMRFFSKGVYDLALRGDFEPAIQVVTNGSLISESLVQELKPLGLKGIKITLDGDEKAHNRQRPFRNGKGSYRVILENLSKLRGRTNIAIGGNFNKRSKESIPRLLGDLAALNLGDALQSVDFKPIFSGLGSMRNHPHDAHVCTFSDIDLDDLLWLRWQVRQRGFPVSDRFALGPCEAMRNHSYTVDPTGTLYACGGFVGWDEFAIGNIWEDCSGNPCGKSLDISLDGECRECPFAPLCAGGCRVSAYLQHGDLGQRACDRNYFQKVAPAFLTEKLEAA
jgi:uncharacterized protein